MEITEANVEKILKTYGLGMDAGLNRDWLNYGFEPNSEKRYMSLEDALLYKQSLRQTQEEAPASPGRVLNLSEGELFQYLRKFYRHPSYVSYLQFCETREILPATFEEWHDYLERLRPNAPVSNPAPRKRDKREVLNA